MVSSTVGQMKPSGGPLVVRDTVKIAGPNDVSDHDARQHFRFSVNKSPKERAPLGAMGNFLQSRLTKLLRQSTAAAIVS
jgi:hypothetical protein